MPAPPPESEPATIRTRPIMVPPALLRRLDRRCRILGAARGGEDRLADIVDDIGEQCLILALRHHADHRLGARRADDEPSRRTKPGLAGGDRLLDPSRLQRPALAKADIA